MSNAKLLVRAAALLRQIIRSVEPEQLGAQTPCTEYDVRKLVNHLLFWGPSLEAAGRKENVPPAAEAESAVELTTGDWAAALEAGIDRTVTAWSEPGAWDGVTHMGGLTELPASMVGAMITGEWVLHGWDLAQATGHSLKADEELLEYLLEEFEKPPSWAGKWASSRRRSPYHRLRPFWTDCSRSPAATPPGRPTPSESAGETRVAPVGGCGQQWIHAGRGRGSPRRLRERAGSRDRGDGRGAGACGRGPGHSARRGSQRSDRR